MPQCLFTEITRNQTLHDHYLDVRCIVEVHEHNTMSTPIYQFPCVPKLFIKMMIGTHMHTHSLLKGSKQLDGKTTMAGLFLLLWFTQKQLKVTKIHLNLLVKR